ncbi:MAG TPA: hypothetical protein VF765_36945 [Polyangiaceae bacterium]
MSRRLAVCVAAAIVAAMPSIALAQEVADAPPVPFATPREALIPGRPGMPGGIHLMINGFAEAQNAGIPGHTINNPGAGSFNAGSTYPLLVDDWAMAYARDSRGWVEGLLMLNFEPLTVGAAGYPEIGQSGEGLWDAQHAHQLLHQAMVAVHPLSGIDGWHPVDMMTEGNFDLSLFGGQGSATIGPPIFMHRASNPGPTVPRKHHKGENPHETFPVLGASLRIHGTWLEASAFSALELTPQDSRLYPHVAAPESYAARVRQDVGQWLELQVSGERLRNQGHGEPDAYQASASAYGWWNVQGWRLDGLLDWALDLPDADASGRRATSQAALGEFAARTPTRVATVWTRSELNQREESPAVAGEGPRNNGIAGIVSSPWFFQSFGLERVVCQSAASGLSFGLFGEATFIYIPPVLQSFYGTEAAFTVNLGVHLSGMWMLGGDLRPMSMPMNMP